MRTPTTRPLALLAVLGTAAVLAGCAAGEEATTVPAGPGAGGAESSSPTPSPSDPTTRSGDASEPAAPSEPIGPAELTVTVDDGTGTTTTRTLTCEPTGGDLATAQQACDQLGAAGTAVFAGVPADTMCTQVYGGPQTATVTGTVGGGQVQASFSRENGCEIARWDALSALLGEADADS